MIWNKKPTDSALVREISERYDLNLLTASIFVRRGLSSPEDIKFYLEKDLRFLHNPFLFEEMEEAVERINAAAEEGEKVFVFGDRDADGITSTVLLVKALKKLGIESFWALPEGDDSYGLTRQVVDTISKQDCTLLITVDCGISNQEEITYASSLGIDTIIIDHHNPQDTLPEALAIINPKLPDTVYPFRDLAGCGVVSKVAWALDFSKTELYNQTVCLLCARPGNETVVVEAVKLVNLVETDRISETFVPGMVSLDKTRLFSFLSGQEVLTYDAPSQTRLLKQIFGNRVDIALIDLSIPITKAYPSLNGFSLLKIREKSRLARFSPKLPSEMDILIKLFISYTYKTNPEISASYLEGLDLVALGTIADLMPLRNENRILVNLGMEAIVSAKRKGLKAILERQNLLGSRISTVDISWQVTPVLNATGRMGVPEKAAQLFFAEEDSERESLAETVLSLNRERKKRGDENWEKILPVAKKSFAEMEGKLVFVGDRSIPRGITGILASRLVTFFNTPSVVVALLENKGVGSMRTIKGCPVNPFLDSLSDLFIDYGGHDNAAGFSFSLENYGELMKRIPAAADSMARVKPSDEILDIDAELPLEYLKPELLEVVELFEPYGQENPPLTFLVKGVKIQSLDLVGKTEKAHVRMLLDTGEFKWPALYWNQAGRVNRDFAKGDSVDIVFRLGRNYFQNKESLQLTILDLKK